MDGGRFVCECESQHQHKENQMKIARRTMVMIVLGSAGLLGGVAPAAAAGSDVRISYSSSSRGYGHSSSAGLLVIDGRRFTIRSYKDIGRQIVRAFRSCGYDASIDYGRVVVCYDPYDKPSVRWHSRGYRGSIYREHGQMTISWKQNYRSGHSYGSGYGHGDSWGNKHYRDKRYQPRRRGRRQWCD